MGSEQPYTTGLFLPINQTTSSYYANEQHAYANYHVVVAPFSCPENSDNGEGKGKNTG